MPLAITLLGTHKLHSISLKMCLYGSEVGKIIILEHLMLSLIQDKQ